MKRFKTSISAIKLAGLISLSACAPGGKSPSGFLNRYSEMNAGYGVEDAVSAFMKPGVDLKKYDSAIIEPVTTLIAAKDISPQVVEQMAAYLGSSIREQVGAELKLVSVASPTTLRVRVALTDVIEEQQAGKPVKTVHLAPRVSLTGTLGSEAVAGFVSRISFEGEMLDSTTGERISALMDHRLGNKREATVGTTWLGVSSAVNQGAKGLRERFVAARAR